MAKHLYVVFTNGPGPGAEQLIRQVEHDTSADGWDVTIERIYDAVRDGACEFVELEDDQGRSMGAGAGEWVEWGDKGQYRALKIRRPPHGQMLMALIASLLEVGVDAERIEQAIALCIDKHRALGSPIAGDPLRRAFSSEQAAFLERGWE